MFLPKGAKNCKAVFLCENFANFRKIAPCLTFDAGLVLNVVVVYVAVSFLGAFIA